MHSRRDLALSALKEMPGRDINGTERSGNLRLRPSRMQAGSAGEGWLAGGDSEPGTHGTPGVFDIWIGTDRSQQVDDPCHAPAFVRAYIGRRGRVPRRMDKRPGIGLGLYVSSSVTEVCLNEWTDFGGHDGKLAPGTSRYLGCSDRPLLGWSFKL